MKPNVTPIGELVRSIAEAERARARTLVASLMKSGAHIHRPGEVEQAFAEGYALAMKHAAERVAAFYGLTD